MVEMSWEGGTEVLSIVVRTFMIFICALRMPALIRMLTYMAAVH
jgi:hypothetical protein